MNFRFAILAVVLFAAGCQMSGANPRPGDAPDSEATESILLQATRSERPGWPRSQEHKFWDKQNFALVAAGAGLRAADVYTTKRFLALGGREAVLPESWVRSDAKFVAFHAGGLAATAGLAWLFHKTRHHRLERATLWVQAGVVSGFVVNNTFYIRRLQANSY